MPEFTGCKVFTSTMERDRLWLGDRVTKWIEESGVEPVASHVVQSSDEAFHCITIVVFYK